MKEELKDERSDEMVLTEGPLTVHTPLGTFEIKPWTFGSYRKVAVHVEALLTDLEQKGIDFELLFNRFALNTYMAMVAIPIEEGKEVDPELINKASEEFNEEYRNLMRMMSVCAQHVAEVIVNTLPITHEELDEFQAEDVLTLFMGIVVKNEGVLKNVYRLFEIQYSNEATLGGSKREDQSETQESTS